MLICDTGGLLAWIDGDHPHHDAVRELMSSTEAITSPLVLAEFDNLLRARFSPTQARTVLEAFFHSGVEVIALSQTMLEHALRIDSAYADLNIGLADASLVVLADQYHSTQLLTLDERHFRAVTPLQSGSFQLFPTDLA